MHKGKQPVLTASHCDTMEKIRVAFEVLTGQSVRFTNFDFNTGNLQAKIGDRERQLRYRINEWGALHIAYRDANGPHDWHTVLFEENGEATVAMSEHNPRLRGRTTWLIGRGATERRTEQPNYLQECGYRAKINGRTLEQQLRMKLE